MRLTIEQLAGWLRVHPVTVQRWLGKGLIEGTKMRVRGSKRWTFNREQITNYLRKYNENIVVA